MQILWWSEFDYVIFVADNQLNVYKFDRFVDIKILENPPVKYS